MHTYIYLSVQICVYLCMHAGMYCIRMYLCEYVYTHIIPT